MTRRRSPFALALAGSLALAFALSFSPPARGYETITHAGLTERAALASTLHRVLIDKLGRPLGLYERLKLAPGDAELRQRLNRLDPEGGFVPDASGMQTALAWLTAGAALEGVPAHRTRNHFLDPARGAGLFDDASSALRTRINDVVTGIGTVRGLFTGASFDGTGLASPAWAIAQRAVNDWGLARFLDERERSAAAASREERDDALAKSLLAAGALAHLVEDAGDPAMVRNDFRVALEADGARYDRFVAERYGRVALPDASAPPLDVKHLAELFRDGQGHGLAERTQRRFFSDGTLPSAGAYAFPEAQPGARAAGYVAGDGVQHLAAFRRTRDGVEWTLDDRCHADYAAALLPEVAGYAAATLELLFRGRLDLEEKDGALHVTAGDFALGAGTLAIYGELPEGTRKQIFSRPVEKAAASGELASLPRPAGARRAAAVFRGFDAAGEPIVIVQELLLH